MSNQTVLCRDANSGPTGLVSWTEDRRVCEQWAKRSEGELYRVPTGLRVADYTGYRFGGQNWLIDHDVEAPFETALATWPLAELGTWPSGRRGSAVFTF